MMRWSDECYEVWLKKFKGRDFKMPSFEDEPGHDVRVNVENRDNPAINN